jgi:hypothetical protein
MGLSGTTTVDAAHLLPLPLLLLLLLLLLACGIQVVECYNDWAGPCKAIASTLKSLCFSFNDMPLKFYTVSNPAAVCGVNCGTQLLQHTRSSIQDINLDSAVTWNACITHMHYTMHHQHA